MKKLISLILILFAVQVYAKDITLAWDYDGECTEFRIYRSEDGGAFWPNRVGTVSCETFQFTDLNVPNGELAYVVTAFEDVESNASNEVLYAYYYALVKFDYDASGRIIYKGENQDISADDSDTDWVITKYYYDTNGMVIEMRVRTTSWTDRATGW